MLRIERKGHAAGWHDAWMAASLMTSHHRAVVWLDHHEARIFHVDRDGFDTQTLRAPTQHVHRHPKSDTSAHEHPDDTARFFGEIARTLQDAAEILVLGPSTAKLHFLRHLQAHDRPLEEKVVGVETVDHPTDPQIVAYAKHYYRLPGPRIR